MNCNYFWQPAPFPMLHTPSTCIYFDQPSLNSQNYTSVEPNYQELKKKCQELELENSRLKQKLSLLEKIKCSKKKRIVKRRKQEELQKKFKCLHTNCKKQYASTLALNLHIKTKHLEDSETKECKRINLAQQDKNSIKQEGQYSNTM